MEREARISLHGFPAKAETQQASCRLLSPPAVFERKCFICVKSGAEKSSGGDVVECGGGGRVAGGGLLVAASRHRRGLETETEQAQPPASEFQRPRNALQRRKAGQPGAGMCQ